jgi:cyclopropane-fatty-acyl-phospholipid synthase
MTTSQVQAEAEGIPFSIEAPRDRRLRLALRMAAMIRVGQITVILPDGSTHRVAVTAEPAATMIIKDPRAATRLMTGGSLGLAEAYIDGLWESPDIRAVMALAAANEAEWDATLQGRPWVRAAARALHWLRPNTRRGARRNIMEHYDLGNDFYRQWLDPSMTYSSALFETSAQSLEAAQAGKIHRLCQALGLQPGMRVLEIGCGWGGFAEVAARDYGADVVGVTLSAAQLAYGTQRMALAGLGHRVELRLQDYRDIPGRFDRVASIEMFEAVGEPYWPVFFKVLRQKLAPGGLAGLQIITISDRLFPSYRRTADFVQRHIFPGGMLPSPSRLREEVARAGLVWGSEHWFGRDYAETLLRWQTAFQTHWPEIARLPMGFDARFKRLWEYYLAYCETGFRAGWTDVGQILLST